MIDAWQDVFRNDGISSLFILLATGSAGILTVYSIGQFHLFWLFWRRGRRTAAAVRSAAGEVRPLVSVHIPFYNETAVVDGTIAAATALAWPVDRLRIRILDDSTDAVTTERIRSAVDAARGIGFDIAMLRRPDRIGFKAGNMAHAFAQEDAEFIAIFDAEFRPKPDFLESVMPRFRDARIGCVQTRPWHSNRGFSWLTGAQALFHDSFFLVEQQGRHASGCFTRFNGSGAVWRRAAIEDAGGWQTDVVSEDLDLSYRAQLKGWRIWFDIDVSVPSELPLSVSDVKKQQRRWAKGRAQAIRKFMPDLIRAEIPAMVKAHAWLDLLNIFIVPAMLVLSIGSLWFVFDGQHPWLPVAVPLLVLSQVSAVLMPMFTLSALWHDLRDRNRTLLEWLRAFPSTLALFFALAPSISAGLVSGLANRPPSFHNTAKYNVAEGAPVAKRADLRHVAWLEGVLAAYFAFGVWAGLSLGVWALLLFHGILAVGYASVFLYSFRRF